jgi:glycerate-2-kinase
MMATPVQRQIKERAYLEELLRSYVNAADSKRRLEGDVIKALKKHKHPVVISMGKGRLHMQLKYVESVGGSVAIGDTVEMTPVRNLSE